MQLTLDPVVLLDADLLLELVGLVEALVPCAVVELLSPPQSPPGRHVPSLQEDPPQQGCPTSPQVNDELVLYALDELCG